jgi:hypothetical protein
MTENNSFGNIYMFGWYKLISLNIYRKKLAEGADVHPSKMLGS